MKVKDVRYELAEVICKRIRKKFDDEEETCKHCPLYIPNSEICFKTIAYLNKKYGNKEVHKDYEQ